MVDVSDLCIAGVLICSMVGYMLYTAPGRQERVHRWIGNGSQWTQTECRVVSTGVAYHGDCDGDKTFPISTCPGVAWCAAAGDMCQCQGTVMYSAVAHSGYDMDYNGNVTMESDGEVRCGHAPNGPFPIDPAEGKSKACFCTPRNVTEIIGERHVHRRACTSIDKEEFQEGNRRLSSEEEEDMHFQDKEDEDMLESLKEENDDEDEDAPAVQMVELEGSNSRRRGWNLFATYCQDIYQPWALVEVPNGDQSQPGSTELRCGYTYGLPFASRYTDTDQVTEIASNWSGTVPCWIRNVGVRASDECAVSMEPLDHLGDEEVTIEHAMYWNYLFLICCFCAMGFGQRNRDPNSREPSQEGSAEDGHAPLLDDGSI